MKRSLSDLFEGVLHHSPALLEIVRRAGDYCRRYLAG